MVNEWIKRSMELANKINYLDRLHTVYPLEIGPERHVDTNLIKDIQKAHSDKNGVGLISSLLELDRFPIDYPYASMFRRFCCV